jgi:hypothetical protein
MPSARLRAVVEQLEQPGSKRSRIRRVDPVLVADVDSRGRLDGPLRDAVLRAVTVAAMTGSADAQSS